MPSLFERWLELLLTLPPEAVYGVIAVLASVENVFPPAPADTAVVFGVLLSDGGRVSPWIVFAVTWAANVASAAAVYGAARTAGRGGVMSRLGRQLVRPDAFERVESWYEKYGTWAIFLSRFVPAVRSVVSPFAGVAGLGAVRALAPTAVASGLWYGALTYFSLQLVRELDDVIALLRGVNVGAAVLAIAVAATVVVWIYRRRARTPRLRG